MRMLFAATLLLGTAGVCQDPSGPQSLGDIARQNRAEKKAVLVITEDDFARTPEVNTTSVTPAAAGDSKTVAGSSADASEKKAGGHKQTSSANDSPDVAALKQKVELLKEAREGWKQSAKKYETLLATETDDFRRQTYETALANDRVNIDHSQQQVDEAQAALAKAQQASASSAGAQSNQAPSGTGTPGGAKAP